MGEEDWSSRMGTSELSSILKSTLGSESVPWDSDREQKIGDGSVALTTFVAGSDASVLTSVLTSVLISILICVLSGDAQANFLHSKHDFFF